MLPNSAARSWEVAGGGALIVGGGCVTETWANEAGFDGYSADAAGAVELCKKLVNKN